MTLVCNTLLIVGGLFLHLCHDVSFLLGDVNANVQNFDPAVSFSFVFFLCVGLGVVFRVFIELQV